MTKRDSFEQFLAAQDEDEDIRLHNQAKVRVACNPWRYVKAPAEIAWVQYTKRGYKNLGHHMVDAPKHWRVPWPTSRNAESFFGKRHKEMLAKVATPGVIVERMNELFEGKLVVCAGGDSLDLFRKLLDVSDVAPAFKLLPECSGSFSIPVRTEAGIIRSAVVFRGYYRTGAA
jgi:hypothetical protein